MFPCSPSEVPTLLLLVTYKIIFQTWELIANIAPFDLTSKILLWIKNCVDVHDFFQPCRGGSFDSALPPHRIFIFYLFIFFCNASSCKSFAQFISDAIFDWSLKDSGYLPVGKGCWSSPFSLGYAVYVMTTVFSICVEGHAISAWFPFTAPSNVKKIKYYLQFTILSSRMYKEKESTWR